MTYQHTVVGVFDPDDTDPPFAYTVGLREKGWPELLIIGPDPRTGAQILNWLSEQDAPPDGSFNMGAPVNAWARPVDGDYAHGKYTFQADEGPVTQIIVPDRRGRFPWDEGCDKPYSTYEVLPEAIDGGAP